MATLMTDEVFHDVAYKAKDRNDLIAGIDEFLDQVTVLPPGEWDPSIRIEPPKNVPSQEKRKKSNLLPNGLVEGEEEEEPGGHWWSRTSTHWQVVRWTVSGHQEEVSPLPVGLH
ncbi:hypothetical protein fugu_000094 [Takifugu bimaculatus]|uniref:Band 3 cytoplasmic domain-containing protein n=1 Tax=Takifugu bimaculatus TaxID=433685 RepID=A0A4Z2CFY9_9TELE|nr:hypothetical protein fugu_000094 [Takifugu bimaculatus]